jgi:small subunit ribosomal protein S17
MSEQREKIRTVTGRVVINKMDKSITVAVERQVKHPAYGKIIGRTSKLLAHDEENKCKEGDLVSITECRPLSRRKNWKLVEIVEHAE